MKKYSKSVAVVLAGEKMLQYITGTHNLNVIYDPYEDALRTVVCSFMGTRSRSVFSLKYVSFGKYTVRRRVSVLADHLPLPPDKLPICNNYRGISERWCGSGTFCRSLYFI